MNTKTALAVVAAFVVGAVGGHVLTWGTMMHDGNDRDMDDTMASMSASLTGKQGDEFDKAFIAGMIVHHQGAVHMAEAALKNAKHDEIKQMANAIIAAQTAEIKQMQEWQVAWYGSTNASGSPENTGHHVY